MKKSILTALFGFLLIFCITACSSEDSISSFTTDSETSQAIRQGTLKVTADATTKFLSFTSDAGSWEVTVDSTEGQESSQWCQASAYEETDGWHVRIDIDANPDIESRQVPLILTSGNKKYRIVVRQEPKKQMKVASDHVDIVKEGGKFSISVKSNGKAMPVVTIPSSATWLTCTDSSVTEKGEEAQTVRYDFEALQNTDLGRLAELQFSTDGAENLQVGVHQWSRELKKEEHIQVTEPGQLQILLGGNAHDWKNLESLTLSGLLNTADMQALRILLHPMVRCVVTNTTGNVAVESEAYLNLRHLDLKDCQLAEGGEDYAEKSIVGEKDTYESKYQTLNAYAFDITRTPIESVVLPSQLQRIGYRAFNMCESLTRIEIPATVKNIGDYAFFNCESLSEIRIPEDSQLEELGMFSLNTGSTLEDISFPLSLNVKENAGILGNVSAVNIHVKWATPPALVQFGVNKNSVLHVPAGSVDAYQNAYGWNRAKEIVAENGNN
ncbi:leucine-rich repeat protein [Prevotella cerevisiae]|uniref:Leucine-rich repeat protein n=1 Tax=Segatella cerevisiae TaxID=2053716 RepID=A0ABT1BXC0_9BACT|nr:leucine-rich repeat protein [Segatella cerevisiae]MCO6024918.1 leucine-rich repeat protein [Segatella cerevisiae]